jgi:hypothetical protein
MKIRIFQEIVNGVLQVRLNTEDWSEGDLDAMRSFGEPSIDLGGSFSSGGSVSFERPHAIQRVKTDSPFVAKFDSRDYDDPAGMALAWKQEVSARIVKAVTDMRSIKNGFDNEEVINV